MAAPELGVKSEGARRSSWWLPPIYRLSRVKGPGAIQTLVAPKALTRLIPYHRGFWLAAPRLVHAKRGIPCDARVAPRPLAWLKWWVAPNNLARSKWLHPVVLERRELLLKYYIKKVKKCEAERNSCRWRNEKESLLLLPCYYVVKCNNKFF